ncbi:MAG TPA: protein kinase [Polyangiaceae bacterium]|nr:protein kinase [Polyangiaceae bacterium]
MSDDTVLQFGHSLREEKPPVPTADGAPPATSCPTCHSRFSPDGRFCPFDGTPLVAAVGWDPGSDALLGSLIDGRYEVLSIIGEGGMGTVYEVRHRALGKRFALKALRKDLAQDTEIAARFIQEARTAAAVSHPGLVEITDFGRLESGQVYFVMELLEGQSLAALLRNGGPLPAARGLNIVRQLVHALKAAHDASIVHRDLKPDNIHVALRDGDTDVVKIVDFGLAKVIGSSKLTRAGMVFGTPHYMSPEQAAGEVVDHRADIYALGIVMYEMFTGKVPFEADSYMGVLTKHMYMAPAPPSELSPELKSLGALEEVILRCLQKRPQARYENLAALLVELDERLPLGSRSGLRASPYTSLLADQLELPSAGERGGPRPAFRYWPALVVALAFVAGVALVIAWRRTPHPPSPDIASPPSPAGVVASPASATAPSPSPSMGASASANLPAAASARPELPARKPTPAGQRPAAAPAPKATSTSGKRRLGGGEIIDPWAH